MPTNARKNTRHQPSRFNLRHSPFRARILLAVSAAASALFSRPASADVFYIGPDGGLWSDPANWSSGSVPVQSDTVQISPAVSSTVNFDYNYNPFTSAGPTVLYVNGNVGATATINQSANTMEVGFQFALASIANRTGIYNLSGSGALVMEFHADIGSTFTGSVGLLNITGGSATAHHTLNIWNAASAVNLSGGSLTVETLDTANDPSRFNWTGGTLAITGNAGLTIGSSQPLGSTLSLGPTQSLQVTSFIDNQGQITATGSSINGYLFNEGNVTANSSVLSSVGNNLGTISATNSTLSFGGSATQSGVITLNGGSYTTHAFYSYGTFSATNTALSLGDVGNDSSASIMSITGGSFLATSFRNNGTFTLTNASATIGDGSANQITNTGTINLHNSNINFLNPTSLPGIVNSDPSTLTFSQGLTITSTGALNAGPGDVIQIGGDLTDNSTSATGLNATTLVMTGTGTQTIHLNTSQAQSTSFAGLVVSSSTLNILNSSNAPTTLTTHDLVIEGNSLPTISGTLNIIGASNISGAQSISADYTNPVGTEVFWTGAGGNFVFSNNATYTNAGVFNAENDQSFTGSGAFHNTGTFRKQASPGATTFNIPFNNDGNVEVHSGTFHLTTSNPTMAGASGTSATATLVAGTWISDSVEIIGDSGSATFTQTSGLHTNAGMILGNSTGGLGVYNLNAGTLSSTGTQIVGNNGNGVVNQSGGLNAINHLDDLLIVGHLAGSTGIYNLSGGTIAITSTRAIGGLVVGNNGNGQLNISGGQINLATGSTVGSAAGSSGSVNHTAGGFTLGSNTLFTSLTLGREAGASGSYHITGAAALHIYGSMEIGHIGTGNFTQDGGTVDVSLANATGGLIYLGNAIGSVGNYTINAGALTVANVTYLGGDAGNPGGHGTLNINGGTVTSGIRLWAGGVLNFTNGTLNAGSTPADNIANDGIINKTGGTLNLVGHIVGTGEITQTAGAATFAALTAIDTTGVTIAGGTASAPGGLTVGNAANSTGLLTVSAGSFNITGTLGVGNTGGLTGGAGTGHVVLSGGSVYADTILLGSAAGGSGDMTISNTAQITVGGGFSTNDVTVNGGHLTVLDQNPPATEDPQLNRSMVGGYLRNGAMTVSGGTVTSPNMKLGLTSGNTGSYTQTAGSVSLSGILSAGNTGSLTAGSGVGHVSVSGGSLYASTILLGSTTGGSGDMTISNTAQVTVGGGLNWNDLTVTGGSLTVLDQAPPATEDPQLNRSMVGGYLRNGAMFVNGGTVVSPNMKLGLTSGNTGSYTQTAGSVSLSGILSAGNTGSLTAGSGVGHVDISGGSLFASTILLGSTTGGSGDMTISNTAQVTVGGGLQWNDVTVNGGSLTVLDQNPPASEDPELNRSMVGGYLTNGAMFVNGGLVSSPNIKMGITAGNTGSYTQTAGSVSVGIFAAGNDASQTSGAGVGIANISGGTLNASTVLLGSTVGGTGFMTVSGSALVVIGGGCKHNDLTINGGTFTVLDQNPPIAEDPELNRSIVGGYLRNGDMFVNGGVVTTPKLKEGITAGNTGSYTQTAGEVTVGILGIGNDASMTTGSGVGHVAITGGILHATHVYISSTAGGVGDLTISFPGVLDLKGSLIKHSADIPTDYAILKNELAAGQIAALDAPPIAGIGLMLGSDYLNLYGPNAIFDSQPVTPSDVLMKNTYLGDADFSGYITINDYAQLDAGFLFGNFDSINNPASWVNGDFNHDGRIDYQDFAIIDFSFQNQSGTLANDLIEQHAQLFGTPYVNALSALGSPTVPEPASAALLLSAAVPWLLRRPRHGRDSRDPVNRALDMIRLPERFKQLVSLLQAEKAEFLVIGGQAVIAHGYRRVVKDIDIWVSAAAANAPKVKAALQTFLGRAPTTEQLTHPRLILHMGQAPYRMDIVTAMTGVSFAEAYPARITREVLGIPVPIIALPQLLKNKTTAARPKDTVDAQHLQSLHRS